MKYRRLGKAGMQVSAVSLGTWLTYGGSVEDATASACIRTAVEHGVNFIDVADAYARGKAEEVVRRAIKDFRRSDLAISGKLYWPMSDNVNDRGLSRKHIMASVEASLRRFDTEYLDIYFCHRFDKAADVELSEDVLDKIEGIL